MSSGQCGEGANNGFSEIDSDSKCEAAAIALRLNHTSLKDHPNGADGSGDKFFGPTQSELGNSSSYRAYSNESIGSGDNFFVALQSEAENSSRIFNRTLPRGCVYASSGWLIVADASYGVDCGFYDNNERFDCICVRSVINVSGKSKCIEKTSLVAKYI